MSSTPGPIDLPLPDLEQIVQNSHESSMPQNQKRKASVDQDESTCKKAKESGGLDGSSDSSIVEVNMTERESEKAAKSPTPANGHEKDHTIDHEKHKMEIGQTVPRFELEALREKANERSRIMRQEINQLKDELAELKKENEETKEDQLEAQAAALAAEAKLAKLDNWGKKLSKDIVAKCKEAEKGKITKQVAIARRGFNDKLSQNKQVMQRRLDEKEMQLDQAGKQLKDAKEKHKQMEKDVKAECNEKIKAARPETNKETKLLRSQLKERDETIEKLEAAQHDLVARKEKFADLFQNAEVRRIEQSDKVNKAVAQIRMLESKIREKDALADAQREELQKQKAQWQIQYDNSEQNACNLVLQQRSTRILSNVNDRNIEEIKGLKLRLQQEERRAHKLEAALRASCELEVAPAVHALTNPTHAGGVLKISGQDMPSAPADATPGGVSSAAATAGASRDNSEDVPPASKAEASLDRKTEAPQEASQLPVVPVTESAPADNEIRTTVDPIDEHQKTPQNNHKAGETDDVVKLAISSN